MTKEKDSDDKIFYVKDKDLDDTDQDFFRHIDQSDNIIEIINNDHYMPPYNIAVIGKWGIGKTTLINFVEKKIKEKCLVIKINAWKYEKEALRKVFLKSVYEELTDERNTTFDIVKEFFSGIFKKKNINLSSTKKQLMPIGKWVLILSLIIYLVPTILTKLIDPNFVFSFSEIHIYTIKIISGYFTNVGTTLLIPAILGIMAIGVQYLLDNNRISVNVPLMTSDDYETLLRNYLVSDKYKGSKKYREKIVVVIDDLDRLSIKKIVEALDSIKTFLNMNNFIFIVPFDDTIIKNVLDKKVISELEDDNQIIKSELILDKLFQFKIYLPPLLKRNLKKYALDMAFKSVKGLVKECGKEDFEIIMKDVLIHKSVDTPRQVKKLINTFANNLLIMKRRQANNKTESNLLDLDGKKIIAKISVLQADFNEFYDTLFVNNNNIEKMLSFHNKPQPYTNLPYELRPFFNRDKDLNAYIRRDYQDLTIFLNYTETIKSDKLGAYLYLNQDEYSVKFGSETSGRITIAMESGDEKVVNSIMKEQGNDIEDLVISIIDEVDIENLKNVIYVSYQILDNLKTPINTLYDIISRKSDQLFRSNRNNFNYPSMSFMSIFSVYINSTDKNGSERLLIEYINNYLSSDGLSEGSVSKMLSDILQHNDVLTVEFKEEIKNVLNNKLINNNILSIDKIIELVPEISNSTIISEYLDLDFFDDVCIYTIKVEDSNQISSKITDWIKIAFGKFNENSNNSANLNKSIIKLYKKQELLKDNNYMLLKNKNLLNSSDIDTIFDSISHYTDIVKSKDDIINIMEEVKYIISDSNKDSITTILIGLISSNIGISVVVDKLTKEDIEKIPNVIDAIIKSSLANNIYDTLLQKNMIKIGQEEIVNIFAILEDHISKIGQEEYMFGRIHQIISKMITVKDNYTAVNTFVDNSVIPIIDANINTVNELSNIILVAKNTLTIDNINRFLESLLTTNLNINTELTLKIVNQLKEKYNGESIKILNRHLQAIVNKENYNNIYGIYKYLSNNVESEEAKENIGWFLVENIDKSGDFKETVKLIDLNYEKISNPVEFLEKILLMDKQKLNIDQNLLVGIMKKYIIGKDIEDTTRRLFSITDKNEYNDYQIDLLLNVFGLIEHFDLSEIITENIPTLKDRSQTCIYNILNICRMGFTGKKRDNLIEQILKIIISIDDEQLSLKIYQNIISNNIPFSKNSLESILDLSEKYRDTVNGGNLRESINTFIDSKSKNRKKVKEEEQNK
ncbi:MAG: P-loop NTPase fold protein [Bacilli bacterium]|nr:P-loop NTPase fold protein [Bacilli bacterium]